MGRLVGVFVCVALALHGCSAGDDEAPSGGAGGSAGSAGAAGVDASGGGSGVGHSGGTGGSGGVSASGGAGASAGTGTMPTTELEACIAYRTAMCERRLECGNMQAPEHCPTSSDLAECPGSAFAPGSSRTVESLNACTEAWRSWPCEKILVNDYYLCEEQGTRQPGEACVYAIQCQSVACDGPPPTSGTSACKTCRRAWQPGDDCTTDDVGCAGYSSCMGDGQCTSFFPSGPSDGTCLETRHCAIDEHCLVTSAGASSGACAQAPPVGQPCGDTFSAEGTPCGGFQCHVCAEGAYCDDTTVLCTTRPTAGMPCGLAAEGGFQCAAGLYCAMGDTCQPRPSAGEPCGLGMGEMMANACAESAFCNLALSPAMCEPLPTLGQMCIRVTGSNWGLISTTDPSASVQRCFGGQCYCPDDDPACMTQTCVRIRHLEESCTALGDQCELGSSCNAVGVCELVPVDRFADACDP